MKANWADFDPDLRLLYNTIIDSTDEDNYRKAEKAHLEAMELMKILTERLKNT